MNGTVVSVPFNSAEIYIQYFSYQDPNCYTAHTPFPDFDVAFDRSRCAVETISWHWKSQSYCIPASRRYNVQLSWIEIGGVPATLAANFAGPAIRTNLTRDLCRYPQIVMYKVQAAHMFQTVPSASNVKHHDCCDEHMLVRD